MATFAQFYTKDEVMKVVADDKIPYLKGELERLADEVVYADGKEISSTMVRDADALIIRTRTHANRQLLEGSSVKFIATATIGFDHIDTDYCKEAGIVWRNAPGCNAASVDQYVHSALLLLQRDRGLALKGSCLGVVGVGHVGSLVAETARGLGMDVLLCDPPRADEGAAGFVSLQELSQHCDIITFHTPLTQAGLYPTWHLADEAFFRTLKHPVYLINTSRGEVVDNNALLQALRDGRVKDAVVDVWEDEPTINRQLLESVFIGTPHVAGYSADGKANATRTALDEFCKFFKLKGDYNICPPTPVREVLEVHTTEEAQLLSYNPLEDSERLKAHPEQFEYLRGHYPLRRELLAYTVKTISKED